MNISSQHYRLINGAFALACGSLLGYAYYLQFSQYLDPCPLCIFQRLAFMAFGGFALLAALHAPQATGRKVYGALQFASAAAGAAIAGRHIWLQNLPPDEVPECGPGLDFMLDTLPLFDAMREAFTGSGECAQVSWTFWGLSMPWWTLIWYVGLGLAAIWVATRPTSKRNF